LEKYFSFGLSDMVDKRNMEDGGKVESDKYKVKSSRV
jgi:hypothetical protein